VIELALFVLAYFKDDAVKPLTHPADRAMLFRQIGTIVLVVGMGEELRNFLKPNPTLQIAPQPLTFASIKVKPHLKSITVIPCGKNRDDFFTPSRPAFPLEMPLLGDKAADYIESRACMTTAGSDAAGKLVDRCNRVTSAPHNGCNAQEKTCDEIKDLTKHGCDGLAASAPDSCFSM
jgi:hypothetical protein